MQINKVALSPEVTKKSLFLILQSSEYFNLARAVVKKLIVKIVKHSVKQAKEAKEAKQVK